MPDEDRRLLWHSNSPHAPTGYGNQTSLFTNRLDGWDVAISAFYGVEGSPIKYNGIPVLPGIGTTYGNETIRDHATVHFSGNLRNGLVVTLMDVWVLDADVWRQLNTSCWVPVDHEPLPPPIGGFFRSSAAVPIAMSKFGQRQLAEFDPLYVPHGVDTNAYHPIGRDEARLATDMPQEAFIVGMVAANKGNPSRKCFHEAFQAFKIFHDLHPEAMLYIHAEMSGKFDGVNMPEMLTAVGVPLKAVLFCDQYRAVHYPFPSATMANIYSSMDVLLMASAGEGFGIPAIEAQACGVPVIVSDFSAQPELVGAGWTVSGRRVYTPLKSWQFLPDIEDIADALRKSYARSGADRELLAKKARGHALEYDVAKVTEEHMLPALDAVWERFQDRAPRALAAA